MAKYLYIVIVFVVSLLIYADLNKILYYNIFFCNGVKKYYIAVLTI